MTSSHCSVQRDDVILSEQGRVLDLLGRQRVDVSDLSGHGHGVAVDDVEVLLPEQQQPLAGVQTLDPRAAVHVLNLEHTGLNICAANKKLTLYSDCRTTAAG